MDEQGKIIAGTYRVSDGQGRPVRQPFWGPGACAGIGWLIGWAVTVAMMNWASHFL